jgi:ComF family protein
LCNTCRHSSAIGHHAFTTSLGVHRLRFVGAYHGRASASSKAALSPLGHCLRAFKDRGDRYAGRCLADLFSRAFDGETEDEVLVVPIPADPARLRQRGHSPSAWLAGALARRQHAQLCLSGLYRCPGRPPQRGLGGNDRRANAVGAFAQGRTSLRGRRVIVVDDVVTTGATLRDAARCLTEAGAARVTAFVLACADEGMMAACRSKTGSAGTSAIGTSTR